VYCVLTPLKGQIEDTKDRVVWVIKVLSLSFRGTPLPLKRNSRFGRKSSIEKRAPSLADVTKKCAESGVSLDTDTYSLRTSQ
jgi:hypothetical protein